MPSRSIASPPSRRPAVSTSVSSTPSRRTVSCSRSRVVPAMSVTMARSLPASALSSELLPAFGGPTITACRPSRRLAAALGVGEQLRRAARAARSRRARSCAPPSVSSGSSAKSIAASTCTRRCEQLVGDRVDAARELAIERAACGARGARVGGGDQVGDGFGLGEVELAVEEGAFAEFARARARARRARSTRATSSLQHDRAAVRLQFDHVFAGVSWPARRNTARCRRRAFAVRVAKRT